jgi:hypothetical protein
MTPKEKLLGSLGLMSLVATVAIWASPALSQVSAAYVKRAGDFMSGKLSSLVSTGNVAIALKTGAQLDMGAGTKDHLLSNGTNLSTPGAYVSTAVAGTNGFSCAVDDCRFDLGPGANDFWYAENNLIITDGNVAVGSIKFGAASGNGNTTVEFSSSKTNGATAVGFSFNTLAFSTDGSKIFILYNNSAEKLNVRHDGAIQFTGVVTGSLPTCNAAHEGSIQYDTTTKTMKWCNATAWGDL